jgi:hypothetical protein
MFGVGNILIDLGRPDRMLNVIQYAQFQSPLLWDVSSIAIYMTASAIYLYLPLIPDIALLRDNLGKRTWFYWILAVGWRGSERQHRWLEIGIAIMAVLVIPVAVSVHTVVSFVFAMTIQPMWHSAIFGPYFVAGAIFSGIAALIIAMALIRRLYHLEVTLLVLFHLHRTPHRLLWSRTHSNDHFLGEDHWPVRPALLDDGGGLFWDSGCDLGEPQNPNRYRDSDRLRFRDHRDVAGAVLYRRPDPFPPTAAL